MANNMLWQMSHSQESITENMTDIFAFADNFFLVLFSLGGLCAELYIGYTLLQSINFL